MDDNIHKSFTFNYKHILVDEIALEGLEGITIDLLWRRFAYRVSSVVTEKMKIRFWNFLVNYDGIYFYQLPEPVAKLDIVDRFTVVDQTHGHLIDPPFYLDGPYKFAPIDNEYGSCSCYETRKLVPKDHIQSTPYDKVEIRFGETLVLVASLQERWKALASHSPYTELAGLTQIHYCILELVGRSRENGQMTVGNTNLTKIVKDSKLLFYNRNFLQKLNLVKSQVVTQVTSGKAVKTILLRLKRFHQPIILSVPKIGKMHAVMNYLMSKPDFAEQSDVIVKNGMLTYGDCKKLQKYSKLLKFEERPVPVVEPSQHSKSKKQAMRKKFICLLSPSDDEIESEDETSDELPCKYKVGISIMRQAYEGLLEAGLKGLTQVELAQILGIEFYTARTICRLFKAKKVVRVFMEDKGKQRTARYVAIPATGAMLGEYENEKKKFLKYLDDSKTKPTTVKDENDPEPVFKVPEKKMKHENEPSSQEVMHENINIDAETIENEVTQVEVLEGLENFNTSTLLGSSKAPTLRQLRYANGLLKVIREKLVVTGYQTLSYLVATEINEPPMDTKALKMFIQKLVLDGQLKILKMKWPGPIQKHTILLCAPHVKSTDPVIKAKYKEISIKSITRKKKTIQPKSNFDKKTLSMFLYPRYLKVQKLHEFLVDLVYFGNYNTEQFALPPGFISLVHIIPEFTIEFALGSVSHTGLSEISIDKITNDVLHRKIRNTPPEIYKMFLLSTSLRNTVRSNLRVLAMLGLIQLIKGPSQPRDDSPNCNYMLYVNKQARVIDTRGTWPRSDADLEKLEKRYRFETFSDVEVYWADVYNISTNTEINLARDQRNRKSLVTILRDSRDAHTNDNGQILGNGLGACGFDSCFYMELPKLWSSFFINIKKKYRPPPKKVLTTLTAQKKTAVKKSSASKPRKRLPAVPKVVQNTICNKKRRNRKPGTVHWSEEEDKIVSLCRAAISVMSPTSQPGCLKLRNLIAKELLSINDPNKTTGVCHKRACTLEHHSVLSYKMDCITNELRYRGGVIQKYDGLYKRLRIRHAGTMAKLLQEARLPMLELVWVMYQMSLSKNFKRMPCVANDIQEFQKNFTTTPSSANKQTNLYKTESEPDCNLAAIKEGIVLSVAMSFKNDLPKSKAERIYSIFTEVPEKCLREAVEHLRRSGAVAAREKILNNQMNKFHFQDLVKSSYKISALYQRKWICRLNSEFSDKLYEIMETELEQTGLKGNSDINCLLFEMQALGVLNVVTATVPTITGSSESLLQEEQLSVIDIMLKFKLKSGSCGWEGRSNKSNKFIEQLPRVKFEDALDLMVRNSKVVVGSENKDENKIISHLRNKDKNGSSFAELLEITGYDAKTLQRKLSELESKHIIKRVGYFENKIILTQFSKLWTVNMKDNLIIPMPWLSLEKNIRYDIFLKWTSYIMNKVFESPGCSVSYLSESVEFLSTRSAQEICMFLERCECVTLKTVKSARPNLFSDDHLDVEFDDFIEYESVDNILVFPVTDCFTRYACLRAQMFSEYYSSMEPAQTRF